MYVESFLLENLSQNKHPIYQKLYSESIKYNNLLNVDIEMAIVRARRILDILVRFYSKEKDMHPGSKPLEQIITNLSHQKYITPLISKYMNIIREFGNLSTHSVYDEVMFEDSSISNDELKICSQALNIIIKWFLESFQEKQDQDNNFTIIQGSNVNYEMIEQCLLIDKLVYEKKYWIDLTTLYKWYDKNNQIYTMIYDKMAGKIVGYINAMPLEIEQYKKIKNGALVDINIQANDIRRYDFPDFYYLYLASICIHPDYQNTHILKILYNAFLNKLIKLSEDEIYFVEVLADAISPQGEKLCEYAGFKLILSSNHKSKIFYTTLLPPMLRTTSKLGMRLISYYKNKYIDFRDLLFDI